MKLKSEQLIKFFGTDELTEEAVKNKGIHSIQIEAGNFSADRFAGVFDEIRDIQQEFPILSSVTVRSIQMGQDINSILESLHSDSIKRLTLFGNIDGADFSELSNFENLKELSIHHNGKFNMDTKEYDKANIGKIILPHKMANLSLTNINPNVEIDTSNLEEKESHSFDRTDNEMGYIPQVVRIKDVSELSADNLDRMEQYSDIDYIRVGGMDENGAPPQAMQPFYDYSPEEYKTILSKLHELTDDIGVDLPEEEKVKQIYEKVSKNIEYDLPAAEPENEEQAYYAGGNAKFNARNLRNGLIEGKCVCRGYAEILRNACSLLGIKAERISGKLNGGGHSWNKIQVNGEWYNLDPTNDHDNFLNGKQPKLAFKRDVDFRRYGFRGDNGTEIPGPKATTRYKGQSNGIVARFRDFISSFRIKDAPLAIPERTEPVDEQPKRENSWDLSNWGIDKEQFIAENAKHMEEYTETIQTTETRETTEIQQEEGFTMHSGHEGGFER